MSIGMYNENGSDVKNSGNITIGNSSVGITADNVTSVENIGDIFSLSENATGIYSNSMNSTNILNSGEIELNGKKVIGIYTEGTGIQTFINDTTGIVKIGDSDNITDPSVAVYNNGNVVNNKGSIISGLNSVGIYNLNGTVNQTSGYIDSQIGGIGIYSIGGNINLNGGQLTNQGIGVYALNNTVINNTGTMTTTGDNTTTYVLKSGSSINNNQKGSIGSNSMFIYGEDAGDINNTGSFITMTGKNSIGFYMNNSGNITNSADITGLGTGNVGIYSNKGIITNSGNINLGDSEIIDENYGINEIVNSNPDCNAFYFSHRVETHRWFRCFDRKEVQWGGRIHEEPIGNIKPYHKPIYMMADTEKDMEDKFIEVGEMELK